MKVILTEQQVKLLKEDAIREVLVESLLMESSFTGWASKIKQALAAGVSAAVIISAISKLPITSSEQEKLAEIVNTEQVDVNRSTNFSEKVDAVRKYMEYAANNLKLNPENIKISPEEIVNACDTTGFDLPLLLAQAHMESCFGLTSRAQRTNSVFSIGSYDNGKNAVVYKTQNDSIKPYIKIMQNNYLNGKSVEDLLSPGGFVNNNNQRYASLENYEAKIKNIRNRILRMYPVLGE